MSDFSGRDRVFVMCFSLVCVCVCVHKLTLNSRYLPNDEIVVVAVSEQSDKKFNLET